MSIIKHIKIENASYKMDNENFHERLNDLKRVNIFVGANNSGKSRFMRSLFFNDGISLKFLPNEELLTEYLDKSNEFKSYENSIINPYSAEKQKAYDEIKKALREIDYIEESVTPLPELVKLYRTSVINANPNHERYLKPYLEYFERFFSNLDFNNNLFKYEFYKMYLPSLRGLIPISLSEDDNIKKDIYAERVKIDYFSNDADIMTDITNFLATNIDSENEILLEEFVENYIFPKNSILSGQKFYDYVKNYLLGDLEQREMIRDYEIYLSETFFDNKKVVLIPKVNDDVLSVRIDEEEYKIYDLGEGIQSIILITLPLFLYLKKSKEANTNVLVFIEEPEVGLHPKLQRILIETLLDERFDNYQFFFTTHSNHFIDMLVEKKDISVYLFEKGEGSEENSTPNFNIKYVDSEYWDVLEKLGALPSSTLMSNCTILVEGITDMIHFQSYLDLYQNQLPRDEPQFKNGVHYSFLIAGGSEYKNNIKILTNLQKEKMCFISDYDNEQINTDREKFFDKCHLHYRYTLNCTEVENLVSKPVIINMLKNTYGLKIEDIDENFNETEYFDSENFYEFIVKNVILSDLPEKFARGKNDLKNPICRSEGYCINNYNQLTDEAKNVAQFIYEFINQNNYN